VVTGQGEDIIFGGEPERGDRFIEPDDDARLAAFDSNKKPSLKDCEAASLAEDRVFVEALVGSFLCVRTDEQRLSVVRIDKLSGPDSEILEISFTTFAK